MRRLAIVLAVISGGGGCRKDAGPALMIVDETTIVRRGDTVPSSSPIFDGLTVHVVAARGETIGLLVYHRAGTRVGGPVTLAGARGFAVDDAHVTRPSTELYGGSRGTGDYPDGLTPSDAPQTDPAYLELVIAKSERLLMKVGDEVIPVDVEVHGALPALPRTVWAYEDPRELAWAGNVAGQGAQPSAAEAQCIALFAHHGVLLSPDLRPEMWDARQAQFAGIRDVPVIIPEEPADAGAAVTAWLARLPAEHTAFAIPIDEPRTPDARRKVRAVADAVRAVDPGHRFHLAVTDAPDPIYGDKVDLFISWLAAHREGDKVARWTYNGAPPYAGNMTVDADAPGLRTWGWIAWRWHIPTWYVWDALYWHDRHNRHGAALPGREMASASAVTFDDGDDHGNRDGVLALPTSGGCRPTLRLASLRRGLQDQQLLAAAATCKPTEAAALAALVVPSALGDAHKGERTSWSTDPASWEQARQKAVLLAASCPAIP